jgi:hypothetical protein
MAVAEKPQKPQTNKRTYERLQGSVQFEFAGQNS